ncbi:MAG: hypothetical protein HY271_04665 [Deltaproteobacteria bacterium]|nr:hypothetical protein [Deltaproteobacteria bacterium]
MIAPHVTPPVPVAPGHHSVTLALASRPDLVVARQAVHVADSAKNQR